MIWISYSKVNLILSLLTTILLNQLEKVQEEKPIIHTPVTNTKPSENLEHIEDLLTGIFERLNSAGKLTLLVFVLYYERFTPVIAFHCLSRKMDLELMTSLRKVILLTIHIELTFFASTLSKSNLRLQME